MSTPSRLALPTRLAFWVLLVVTIGFGTYAVYRTACLSRKMGDLDCYLRAGWAVRAGVCPYDVVCDNHWHYNYPPPYAVLMAPLADPPARDAATTAARLLGAAAAPTGAGPLAEASRLAVALAACENPLPPDTVGWCVPFVVSTVLCYLLNVLALFAGVHLLASALERGRAPDAERWWWLRLAPVWICLVPLGQTLMRGQVNTLVVFLVCGLLAARIDRRSFRAGLYLATAIALKVIPGFLLLLPLWLRDRRCLAGTAVGLVGWLVLFPLATLGPSQTVACYDRFLHATLGPALRLGGDTTRAEELIKTTVTDNQSFGAVLHNCLHPDRLTRPREAEPWTRHVHWAFGGFLTLLTLLAAARGPLSPPRLVLLGGALTTLMALLSPVCHLHYLAMLVPLWMGLLVARWDRQGWRGEAIPPGRHAVHWLFLLALIPPTLPGLEPARDLGVATATALAAWGWAVVELARGPARTTAGEETSSHARAA